MNYEQEKRVALNHALVSNKLKVLIKLFDKESPQEALTDLRYAVELFTKKVRETRNTNYY